MTTTEVGGLLDAREVAEILGVTTRTLRRWRAAGITPQPAVELT